MRFIFPLLLIKMYYSLYILSYLFICYFIRLSENLEDWPPRSPIQFSCLQKPHVKFFISVIIFYFIFMLLGLVFHSCLV